MVCYSGIYWPNLKYNRHITPSIVRLLEKVAVFFGAQLVAQATGAERGMLAKTSGDEYCTMMALARAVKTIVHLYILLVMGQFYTQCCSIIRVDISSISSIRDEHHEFMG